MPVVDAYHDQLAGIGKSPHEGVVCVEAIEKPAVAGGECLAKNCCTCARVSPAAAMYVDQHRQVLSLGVWVEDADRDGAIWALYHGVLDGRHVLGAGPAGALVSACCSSQLEPAAPNTRDVGEPTGAQLLRRLRQKQCQRVLGGETDSQLVTGTSGRAGAGSASFFLKASLKACSQQRHQLQI